MSAQATLLGSVPDAHREAVRSSLAKAFDGSSVDGLAPVAGGASGALTYRAEADGRSWLLRIETRRGPLRNPHQYACLRAAAEAGIAPAVRYLDADAGVVVMDFLRQRPLSAYPGGSPALARDMGTLVRRLQATPAFPELHRFPDVLRRMLDHLRGSGAFERGLLDPHAEGLARVLEAYPWEAATGVSSHNDPNPRNVVFDGERLWLVDWETAYRSDPLVDVAIVAENLAPTPELEGALLDGWTDHGADASLRARLTLMRLLTRMYYAGLLLGLGSRLGDRGPETDLTAMSPAEFGAALARGELKPASPEAMWALGKMSLAGFLGGLTAPGMEDALKLAAAGWVPAATRRRRTSST